MVKLTIIPYNYFCEEYNFYESGFDYFCGDDLICSVEEQWESIPFVVKYFFGLDIEIEFLENKD